MKRWIIMVLLVFSAVAVFAQSAYYQRASQFERGYIYLKDGSVFKGSYLYSPDMDKIRINSGRNSMVLDASEVEKISKMRPAREYAGDDIKEDFTVKPPRLFNITDAGLLVGNPDNSQSAPLVFGTAMFYNFHGNFSAGAGLGVEFLKETYVPLSLNLMYKLKSARVTPYFNLQAGYQIPVEDSRALYYSVVPDYISSSIIWPGPWPTSQTELEAKGGLLLNPTFGILSFNRFGYGFNMSVGYRFHRLRYSGENDYNLDIDFNRLSVKLGVAIN